jgi:hypothetical protein
LVTVTGAGEAGDVKLERIDRGAAATFQWQQMESGDIMLLSLATHRYLAVESQAGNLASAEARGAEPDRGNGAAFEWRPAPAPEHGLPAE